MRLARFELATPGFVGRCSIQMSYSRRPCNLSLRRDTYAVWARGRQVEETPVVHLSFPVSCWSLAPADSFLYLARCRVQKRHWRGGREAEGGGLLNRYTAQKLYRGFESLPLR